MFKAYKQLVIDFISCLKRQRILIGLMLVVDIIGTGIVFILPENIKLFFFIPLINKMAMISESYSSIFTGIFVSNVLSSLFLMLFGFLCFPPLIYIFINGIGMGLVFDFSAKTTAFSGQNAITLAFASILPHGILEIPLMLITGGLSMLFGLKLFFPKRVEVSQTRIQTFISIIKFYVFIIIPLTALAAFIESYITPVIAAKFVKPDTSTRSNLLLSKEELDRMGLISITNQKESSDICSQTIFKISLIQMADKNKVMNYQLTNMLNDNQKYYFSNNSALYIYIRQYRSLNEGYTNQMDTAFTKLSESDDSVKITKSGSYYIIVSDNQICTIHIGSVNSYTYIMANHNIESSDFDKIIEAQIHKL